MPNANRQPSGASTWPKADVEGVEACPACRSPAREPFLRDLEDRVYYTAPGSWELWRCEGCASLYLDPRPTIGSIHRAYAEYYTHDAPPVDDGGADGFTDRLRAGYLNARLGYRFGSANRLGRIVPLVAPGKAAWMRRTVAHVRWPVSAHPKLLEVGFGAGVFLDRMAALGWEVTGIDVDSTAVAAARSRGLHVERSTLEELAARGDRPAFDAIVIEHVIEHLHDPGRALAAARTLMRPGGQLVVITPNSEADGLDRWGSAWMGLDPPRHLCVFSSAGLEAAIRDAGFQAVSRLRSAPTVASMERHSLAVSEGRRPFAGDAPDAPRWATKIITAKERVLPSRSEELVFSATCHP